jgi:hypothetical protein
MTANRKMLDRLRLAELGLIVDGPSSTRANHTLRSNAVSPISRQPGAARFTSEVGRCLRVNIPDSGRSGRLVRVCAEFQSIGLANRFEPVYLDKRGVTIYGWGASLVRMPAHGPFPGLDAVSWPRTQNRIKLKLNSFFIHRRSK